MKHLIALILTLFAFSAHAATADEEFYEQVKAIVDSGTEPTDVELKDLTAKEQHELLKAAEYEANVWYDTILEGDYQLDSDAKLELTTVQKFYVNNKFIAYRISYAHGAYATGACEVEYENEYDDEEAYNKYLKENCPYGRIVGAAYVSPGFEIQFRDDDAIEDFED